MKTNRNTTSCNATKEMIKNGRINIDELSKEQLNHLVDDIINNLDPDSVEDTTLLDECYKRLDLLCSNTEIVKSDRYISLAESIVHNYDKENGVKDYSTKQAKKGIHKKTIVIIMAAVLAIFLSGCCIASVLGFNVLDLGKKIFSFPEKQTIEKDNVEIVWTDDDRLYQSPEELIVSEKIDIMYFDNVPEEYTLSLAKFSDLGDQPQVLFIYKNEDKVIKLLCIMNMIVDLPTDNIYSINGNDYMITKTDDVYMAIWIYNGHYHSLSCSEENIMYKILEEMKGGPYYEQIN